MAVLFLVGLALIATEHKSKLDKGAVALVLAFILWSMVALLGGHSKEELKAHLGHTTMEVAQIVLFLLGAMTIVEMVSLHGGFDIITKKLSKIRSKAKLLVISCVLTFFLSALLDNMTITIVMAVILRGVFLRKEQEQDRFLFTGMVVLAANAGGAWSPMGDVTTTMLWVGDKVSALKLIQFLLIPSLICMLVPLGVQVMRMWGQEVVSSPTENGNGKVVPGAWIILTVGIGGLLAVPALKVLTGLPPFMCMLFSLGLLWVTAEVVHKGDAHLTPADAEAHNHGEKKLSVAKALERIGMPSILFFAGILLAVGALQAEGLMVSLAELFSLSLELAPEEVAFVLGLLSGGVDNVPLTAASMGMYNLPMDDPFWHSLAYCVGTGGTLLIIGSAAGVVVMSKKGQDGKEEGIPFFWYALRIGPMALLGYFSGYGVLLLLE
ncbi:MAG: sodium:proton antiporter NhaD [bacterium]|nr:sodium:proton antiporter NhaD [bacterium]